MDALKAGGGSDFSRAIQIPPQLGQKQSKKGRKGWRAEVFDTFFFLISLFTQPPRLAKHFLSSVPLQVSLSFISLLLSNIPLGLKLEFSYSSAYFWGLISGTKASQLCEKDLQSTLRMEWGLHIFAHA